MHWYLIHTKPRQERRALQNLEQQGYECYLPMITVEKLKQGMLSLVDEPLFPRYLFIHLDASGSKSWGPIRSTRGVHRLVTFGTQTAVVDDQLIEVLREQGEATSGQPRRLFSPGERVTVIDGAFAGIEAVYQMIDGESRAIVLIDFMNKATRLGVAPSSLKKMD